MAVTVIMMMNPMILTETMVMATTTTRGARESQNQYWYDDIV